MYYKVIYSIGLYPSSLIEEVSKQVNSLYKKGWKASGGINFATLKSDLIIAYQTLIK